MSGTPDGERTNADLSLVSASEKRDQVEQIVNSKSFRSSPALRRFLEHVVSKTIEGLSDEIKESTIGIEVFGRAANFDPRIDTVVRVEAHRLREKLRRYYDNEGSADPILLLMPKGRYIPEFSRRTATAPAECEQPILSSQPPRPSELTAECLRNSPASQHARVNAGCKHKPRPLLWLSAALAMVIIVLGLGVVLPRRGGKRPVTWAQSDASASPNEPLRSFWSDFLRGENSAIVAFSDAPFLATQTADLLRLKKGEEVGELGTAEDDKVARRRLANPSLLEYSGPLVFNDAYTGTGEVMGVYFLTRVFEELHFPLVVKRSRLLTVDDLKRHNLIFLGSIMENPMESVPLKQDFVFV